MNRSDWPRQDLGVNTTRVWRCASKFAHYGFWQCCKTLPIMLQSFPIMLQNMPNMPQNFCTNAYHMAL